MKNINSISRYLILLSVLLMVPSFFVPIWEIAMWAPQYPEGLAMFLWIDNITGDVDIINGLNHYIGMKHIKVEMFPEFSYMKYIVMGMMAFGIISFISNKRVFLFSFFAILVIAGTAGMYDFYAWGLDYGSNLDPTAAIKVPGMVYQPPIIGTKELLNFTAFSGPAIGGWFLAVSGITLIIAIIIDWKSKKA